MRRLILSALKITDLRTATLPAVGNGLDGRCFATWMGGEAADLGRATHTNKYDEPSSIAKWINRVYLVSECVYLSIFQLRAQPMK